MRERAAIATGFLVTAVVLLAGGCGGAGSDTPSAAKPAGGSAMAGAMPSGELIAFERMVPGAEERDLYAVGADGGEPRLLNSPGDYPHWSPDGSVLAFNACLNPPDCTTAVALLDRSTGDVHGHSMPDPELFTA
ncbi:MAG TPA: hypothetical protein VFL61_08300, partial [Gaiellaceae bacterium]|nr:hypothetical protein [Gaiellaceae bacterium]